MKLNKLSITFIIGIAIILALGSTVFAQSVNGTGWWTAVQVQRVASAIPGSIDVTMEAYAPQGVAGGPWICGTRPLASLGSGATFFPHWASDPAGSNCANVAGFPSEYQGSSVLSAGDQIVAIAQTQNIRYGTFAPGDTPYGRAVAAYGGIGSPSTEVKFPVYKNNHSGEMTTFFVQNAGGSNANITATFKPCADQGNGTPCLGFPNTYTYQFSGLEPNKMIVFDATLARNPWPGGSTMPAGTGSFGGLTVTSGQDLAGVVLEHNKTASPAVYLKATRGFGANDYDSILWVPAIKYLYPQGTAATKPNSAKWSGLVVHNADSTSADVIITYTLTARNGNPNHPDVGTQYTQNKTIASGGSAFFLFYNAAWANPPAGTQPGDLFSAKIDGTGKNLVAIVNEEGNFALAGDRDLATYSAMPNKIGSTSISIPAYKETYNGKFHGVVIQNVGNSSTTINATITVVASRTGSITAGEKVKIQSKNTVGAGKSVVLLMSCRDDTFNSDQWIDQAGDDGQMADLCGTGANPTLGTNNSLIIDSVSQPVVALANEELLWYINPTSVADGHGEDASNYEGFPLTVGP